MRISPLSKPHHVVNTATWCGFVFVCVVLKQKWVRIGFVPESRSRVVVVKAVWQRPATLHARFTGTRRRTINLRPTNLGVRWFSVVKILGTPTIVFTVDGGSKWFLAGENLSKRFLKIWASVLTVRPLTEEILILITVLQIVVGRQLQSRCQIDEATSVWRTKGRL